jgi:two-component system, response regulator RegA
MTQVQHSGGSPAAEIVGWGHAGQEGFAERLPPLWPRSVLIADPETSFREGLARRFVEQGCQVDQASDIRRAGEILQGQQTDLLVIEVRLAEGAWRGLDLVQQVTSRAVRPRVVVLTAYGSISTAVRAVRLGVDGYLTKPATPAQIVAAAQGQQLAQAAPEVAAMTLDRAIWEYISAVYDQTRSMARAARWLGIDRRSLRRMLAKYAPS